MNPDHAKHDHCGCCGRCYRDLAGYFCVDCTSSPKHLGSSHLPPWDRTYEAGYKKSCPFAEACFDQIVGGDDDA